MFLETLNNIYERVKDNKTYKLTKTIVEGINIGLLGVLNIFNPTFYEDSERTSQLFRTATLTYALVLAISYYDYDQRNKKPVEIKEENKIIYCNPPLSENNLETLTITTSLIPGIYPVSKYIEFLGFKQDYLCVSVNKNGKETYFKIPKELVETPEGKENIKAISDIFTYSIKN